MPFSPITAPIRAMLKIRCKAFLLYTLFYAKYEALSSIFYIKTPGFMTIRYQFTELCAIASLTHTFTLKSLWHLGHSTVCVPFTFGSLKTALHDLHLR